MKETEQEHGSRKNFKKVLLPGRFQGNKGPCPLTGWHGWPSASVDSVARPGPCLIYKGSTERSRRSPRAQNLGPLFLELTMRGPNTCSQVLSPSPRGESRKTPRLQYHFDALCLCKGPRSAKLIQIDPFGFFDFFKTYLFTHPGVQNRGSGQ